LTAHTVLFVTTTTTTKQKNKTTTIRGHDNREKRKGKIKTKIKDKIREDRAFLPKPKSGTSQGADNTINPSQVMAGY
jgi:hypothetical protein